MKNADVSTAMLADKLTNVLATRAELVPKELDRVEGVHGPRQLHVVLCAADTEEAPAAHTSA